MLKNATVNEWKKLGEDIESVMKDCAALAGTLRFTIQYDGQTRIESQLDKVDQMLKEMEGILQSNSITDREIVEWASAVNVEASCKDVLDSMGRPSVEEAATWFDTGETSHLRKWLGNDDAFWLIGSGQ